MEKKEYSTEQLLTEMSIRITSHLKDIRALHYKNYIQK